MKKFLSMLLALVMVLGMTVPAMAEVELSPATDTADGKVQITAQTSYETKYNVKAYTNNGADNTDTVMAYEFNSSYNFSIYGKYDGKWKITSFGNYGFETVLGIVSVNGNGKERITEYPVYFQENVDANGVATGTATATVGGLEITLIPTFTDGGKTINLQYKVKNLTDEQVIYYLASHADVQIGSDDYAVITVFDNASGFKMVSDNERDMNDLEEGAQFNFFGENSTGFWFGYYGDRDDFAYDTSYSPYYVTGFDEIVVLEGNDTGRKNFFNSYSMYTDRNGKPIDNYGYDSGCSWYWKDTVANSTATPNAHSVKIGIGGKGSEILTSDSSLDYINTKFGGAMFAQNTTDESAKIDFTKDYTLTVKVGNTVIDSSKYEVTLVDANTLKVVFNQNVGVVLGISSGSQIKITASQTVTNGEESTVIEAEGSADCRYKTSLFEEELTKAPAGLTVDEVKALLKTVIDEVIIGQDDEKVIKYMDVTLKKQNPDGSWTEVANDEIPASGIDVVIPYPAGTDEENFAFAVSHVLSNGTVEKLNVIDETTEGIKVNVKSFSPFAVGYYVDNPDYVPPVVPETPAKPVETVTIVIDGTEASEEDVETEQNPNTGAPVMNVLPAFAVICAAAFLGKRK